jgi:hypothetical protein
VQEGACAMITRHKTQTMLRMAFYLALVWRRVSRIFDSIAPENS